MLETNENDFSFQLEMRLQEERRIEQIRRKERNESHLYTTLNVFLEDCFDGHQGPDLFDSEQTQIRAFKVKKNNTVEQILAILCQSFVSSEITRVAGLICRLIRVINASVLFRA